MTNETALVFVKPLLCRALLIEDLLKERYKNFFTLEVSEGFFRKTVWSVSKNERWMVFSRAQGLNTIKK